MIKIHNGAQNGHVYVYELGCYSKEFGPLSHREEHATKKAAMTAAKKLIKEYEYIELTLLEKDELGYMIEGNVVKTYYKTMRPQDNEPCVNCKHWIDNVGCEMDRYDSASMVMFGHCGFCRPKEESKENE